MSFRYKGPDTLTTPAQRQPVPSEPASSLLAAAALRGRAAVYAGAFAEWSGDPRALWLDAARSLEGSAIAGRRTPAVEQAWCTAYVEGALDTLAAEALSAARMVGDSLAAVRPARRLRARRP